MANKYGGGASTNKNGLKFEQDTSLDEALENAGYAVIENRVYFSGREVGLSLPKYDLYRKFLVPQEVDWQEIISKRLLPDEAIYTYRNNTMYIIEKKFQSRPGSVDEKLQTCGFKKYQYQRLLAPLGINVEYLYICNGWFAQPQYRDVHKYISDMGCYIFFNEIPLDFLGL